MELNCGRVQLN